MTPEQIKLTNDAVRKNLLIREIEADIAKDPNGYYAEVMGPELPAMREAARIANNAAHDALNGYRFNPVTDDWEKMEVVSE